MLDAREAPDRAVLMPLIERCPIFRGLDAESLEALYQAGQVRRLREGDTLYRVDELSDGTFCMVIEGTLEVVARTGAVVSSSTSDALAQSGAQAAR